MLWVMPVLAAGVAGGLIGALVAIRWVSRQRWRVNAVLESTYAPRDDSTVFYRGTLVAAPDDDEPEQ